MAQPRRRLGWVTLLGFALALWAWADVLVGRQPGWPEAIGVGLFAFALVVASAHLGSQGFLPALVRGPADRRQVGLSFDDGPDPSTTPEVLATLATFGAHATFFVIGEKAAQHPDLLRRIAEAGHEVASHGYRHSWRDLVTPRRAVRDLQRTTAAIEASGIDAAPFFRPPYGVAVPALAVAVRQCKVDVVGWSLRTFDAAGRGDPEARGRAVGSRAAAGDIILLHDAPQRPGGRPPLGPMMLEPLLQQLARRGLRGACISELFGLRLS